MFDISSNNSLNLSILQNYDFLSDTGIVQYIEKLNHEIVKKNELIDEAIEIFNKKNIDELVNYITLKFLNKFIPETLTFIIQNNTTPLKGDVISFRNMKRTNSGIKINNFNTYNDFFLLSPTSITFEAFQVMMDDPKFTEIFKPLNPELLVPMMGLDGLSGFIIFGKKIVSTDFEKEEIDYIDEMMKFVSISIQNIIHYNRAILDLKTKLYNHDFFIHRMAQELNRVKRYSSQFGLIMIDIDHFKNVNNTYGHVVGDKIIKIIATTISETIRAEDVAARFGGEEFIIMLVECNKDLVFTVAERIRKKIEMLSLKNNNVSFKVTISLGTMHVSINNIELPDDMIKKVDAALYYSKEHGRNRTTDYSTM